VELETGTLRGATGYRCVNVLDDMALSDEALEAWLAVKINRRPLVRTMSALEGFVTAAVIGPTYIDPQYWICPAMGLRFDVLGRGSEIEQAAFASVARVHNHVNETLSGTPEDYAARFATKANGNVDPHPWCQGFYAAMNLNMKDWKPLLNQSNIHHSLLLPILIYCVDTKGHPVLGKLRPGPETVHFLEHEAHQDIAKVVPTLRELHQSSRYSDLK
jgi:uncharacterized protein